MERNEGANRPDVYDGMAPKKYDYRINKDQTLLTQRRAEVLVLVAKGLGNKEIAAKLGIEIITVKNHVHYLFQEAQRLLGNNETDRPKNRVAMLQVFERPEVDVIRLIPVVKSE